jgi:hypothetical protein
LIFIHPSVVNYRATRFDLFFLLNLRFGTDWLQ